MTAWTPADILPASHPDDTGRTRPHLRLLRALSGPADPPPVFVDFITLAEVAERVQTVEWV